MATTDLQIKISADVAELKTAMAQAQAQIKALGTTAQSSGAQGAAGFKQAASGAGDLTQMIKGSAAGMFIATAAMSALSTAVDVVQQRFQGFLDTGDRLSELAEKTGLTVEQLSGLAFAADQSDTNLDGLANGLKKLSINLDGADEEGKKATATFKRLGISTLDAQGNTKGLADLLPEIADKVAGLASPIQKTAIATALFGKEGQTLVPLLSKGSAGIAEMTAQAQAMGLVMSTQAAEAADKLKDKISALSQVNAAGFNNAFADAAPQMEALIDLVTQLKTEGGNGNLLGGIIGSGADAIRETIEGLRTIGAAFEPIIDLMGNMVKLLGVADEKTLGIGKQTNLLREFLEATALEIALIVDLFQKGVGVVQYLGSAIITALVAPLSMALGVVGSIVGVFDKDLGAKLQATANQANGYTASLRASAVETIKNANAVDTVRGKMKALREEEAKRSNTREQAAPKAKATGKLASAKDAGEDAGKAADKAKQIADAQYQLQKTLLENEQKLIEDALKDTQKAYDDAYAQGLLSITDYYNTRETIERTRLESLAKIKDAELAEAQKRKAVSDKLGDVAGSLKAQTEIEKIKLDVVLNKAALERLPAETTIAVRKAQDELNSAALKVNIELAQLQGLQLDRATIEASIREQYKSVFDKFKTDPAMTAKLEAIVNIKVNTQDFEQQLKDLELKNRANTQPLDAQRAQVEQQQSRGQISQPRAQAKLEVINAQQVQQLQGYLQGLETMRANMGEVAGDAEKMAKALELDAKINATKSSIEGLKPVVMDLGVELENSFANNGAAALESFMSGTKSAKEAFADFAKSVIADLIKMIAKMLIMKAIKMAFGGFADGGPVQAFATGGAVLGPGGPRDDVIPAYLSNGEHVMDASTVASFGGHGFFNALRAVGNGRAPMSVVSDLPSRLLSSLGNLANLPSHAPTGSVARLANGGAAVPSLGKGAGQRPVTLVNHFTVQGSVDARSQQQIANATFNAAMRAKTRLS